MARNQPGTYRYKPEIPSIDFDHDGFPSVICYHGSFDWDTISWGRFGSGGSYDARHCFVDDWRLEHLWRRQGQGLAKAMHHGVMTAPDFSVESHYPAPFILYQTWRSRVLTRYWIDNGVTVVPVLQWGSVDLFHVCVYGIRRHSVVAVRGPQKGTEEEWSKGAAYMQKTLKPSLVLHFGRKIDIWENVLFFPLRSTK